MFDYPVTLNPDGGTVLVTFAEVPETITFGADEDEALFNAVDALETGFVVLRRRAFGLARCQQARARAKDGAPAGAGVRQIGGVSGNDRAVHQKGRTGPPFGLAHASG